MGGAVEQGRDGGAENDAGRFRDGQVDQWLGQHVAGFEIRHDQDVGVAHDRRDDVFGFGGLMGNRVVERERAVEKLATLTQARDELSAHFKALAGDALELNRKRMADQHQGALDQILKPPGEKLVAFQKKVEETYDEEAQQRFSLQEERKNLHLATTRIKEDASLDDIGLVLAVDAELFRLESVIRWLDTADGRFRRFSPPPTALVASPPPRRPPRAGAR